EEIADRRSFQIFLELSSGDSIPDETTICRYRELFARLGLDKKLLKRFNSQLKDKGLLLEKGTIVDATLKEAQAKKRSGRDKDTRATVRKNRVIYGYKGHIGMDTDHHFIHSVEFTPADVHDSTQFDKLVHKKEKAVFGDKGYANEKRKRRLREQGIYCGIIDKAYRNRPLTSKQKKRNRKLSLPRSSVERPFAFFRRILEYDRCSYYDLERNRFEFVMASLVYNMRRYMTLGLTVP
ncbi:IS5 family transposase, partial [bacterium]|nr:IS5 family transposase [bacterium]